MTKKSNKDLVFSDIFIILTAAFIFRVVLSFFGTLQLDFNTFLAWGDRLISLPLTTFYQAWSDYLPGYLYVLWFLAKLKKALPFFPNELLYKLPAIFADLTTGLAIYKIVNSLKSKKFAVVASCLYLFNPAVFSNSSLWGQVDSLTALFSLLAVYFFEKHFLLSAILLAAGVSIKIQATLALIPILFLAITKRTNLRKLLLYGVLSLFAFVATFIPFNNDTNIFVFIYQRISLTLGQYPYTSVNAFNFWGFFGFWLSDKNVLIPPSIVSVLILLVVSFLLFLKLKKTKGGEYILLAVAFAVGFLFFPRMHERHLLPVFAPLVISSVLIPDLWLVYLVFSISYLANLYYSFIWITQEFKTVFSKTFIRFLILSDLAAFVFLLKRLTTQKSEITRLLAGLLDKFKKGGLLTQLKKHLGKKVTIKNTFPKSKLSNNILRIMLIGVLVFSFATRVYNLSKPDKEYFDEVYHAFTAKLMLQADPKAWEWWNPNPEGFAYEWTHPPVAKLGMELGMKVFGENSFGWRIPGAILGAGSVFLVYLLARLIFNDELVGILSAATFSLDGLPLVASRIGMNDAYLLFFVLLSLYFYLRDKNFLSALFLGLALASKWSGLWSVPIFVVSHFVFKKKFRRSYLWFLFLPPLVYVASYTQMFLTGHGFDIFIGDQKQMWWYHTRLRATHAYSSLWWSWPVMARPIWLYTDSLADGRVSNIYAMGNPIVFWTGFAALVSTAYRALVERSKKLGWVVFSYLVFFTPWAVSPRIMFLYHYLPSIPFLSIALAFVLRKNPKLVPYFLISSFLLFFYFYPHFAGIEVPRSLDNSYYWFESWR
jgi:predicted membrane-bound dolichyl-phosphate-mannose-protein mannosyltransferase